MSRELELYADLLYTDLRKCLKDNRRNFRKALNRALAEGFDVNYVPSNLNFAYFSLLDTALYDYNFIKNPDEVISLLLEAGADVNLKDRYRSTPIFTAALHAPPHIIHMMLQRTTDINIVSNDGHTVLQFLIWRYMDAYSRYSSAQFIQLIKEVLDKGGRLDNFDKFMGENNESPEHVEKVNELRQYIQRYLEQKSELQDSIQAEEYEYEL